MSESPALLRWPGAASWIASVRTGLVQAAGERVFERFRIRPPGANRTYDELWLGEILGTRSHLTAGEIVDQLAADLTSRYRAVRAFHAGRPLDPEAYRRHGLLLSTPARLVGEAQELFAGEEAALAALLPQQHLSLVDGCVYLQLDRRFLLHQSTFYPIYGSYFLLGLAIQLERATGRPMRERLRARGVPTVAACDVPLTLIPAEALRQLCCQGIREALASAGEGPEAVTDFQWALHQPLPPQHVVSCRHPRRLTDPL